MNHSDGFAEMRQDMFTIATGALAAIMSKAIPDLTGKEFDVGQMGDWERDEMTVTIPPRRLTRFRVIGERPPSEMAFIVTASSEDVMGVCHALAIGGIVKKSRLDFTPEFGGISATFTLEFPTAQAIGVSEVNREMLARNWVTSTGVTWLVNEYLPGLHSDKAKASRPSLGQRVSDAVRRWL